MIDSTKILALREGGNVTRCHGIPHVGSYTNASHSWHAAILLLELYPGTVPPRLMNSMLLHDIAERWVGDMPSPAASHWPELGEAYRKAEAEVQMELLGYRPEMDLSPEDFSWLKSIDRLELYLWCHEQYGMGNRNVLPWIRSLKAILIDAEKTPQDPVRELVRTYNWLRTDNSEFMKVL
jgi:5'-deoxynucleotidase YfbR-like HD superfamily hydrolase